MSLPRYAKYKESGVEWLGQVPEHWDTISLGKVTCDKCDGPFGSGLKSEHYTDSGVRVIRLQNIRQDGFDGSDEAFVDESYYDTELGGHDVRGGDVLIAGLGDERNTVGRACVAPSGIEPAMVKADCFRFRLDNAKSLPEFIALQLTASSTADAGVLSSGSTRSRIPLSVMATRKIALPPLSEQSSIAEFLDRETAKIDGLVGEQRRLIELLREKRQAVISHAVTKGLNPNAPMKPSGIEWLGEVPAHWRALAVKNLARSGAKTFTDGDWIESPFITTEGVRLIQTGNVGVGHYKEQGFRYISEETFEQLGCTEVNSSDVLICRLDGPVGRACLAPDLGCRMITSVDNAILKCATDIVPEFVVSLLSSVPWISWIDALCRVGGGFRLRVSRGQLGELRVPVPPFEEQLAIAKYLEAETLRWDELTAEAQRAIELLQERRTALISAAVTGKIDVRGLAESGAA